MNNFRRFLFVVVLVFSVFSFGFAATTGNNLTGNNLTGSDSLYSGDLSIYAKSMKQVLINLVDSGYDKVYRDFQKTGLNIMKTVDYQSLVCLGILSSDSGLFMSMQNKKQLLKKDILKLFSDIDMDISNLEEKNRILKENGINLFESTNGYEYEKKLLKKEIDNLMKLKKEDISIYVDNYEKLIGLFVKDFFDYKSENQDLLSSLNEKISKIRTVLDNYSVLNQQISKLNGLLLGSSKFELAFSNLKKVALDNYDKKLVKLIDKYLKRYKRLSGLETLLDEEKQRSLDKFTLSFEESLSKVFTKFYRHDRYLTLSDSLGDIERNYYLKGRFNCKNLLISDSDLLNKLKLLDKDISTVLASVNSGVNLANDVEIAKKFRTDIVATITNFYKKPSISIYNEFEKASISKIRELSNISQSPDQIVPSESGSSDIDLTLPKQYFSFDVPFKLNEKNDNVKILQQLLAKISYYSGTINGIYDSVTLNAVYMFQKANGLLKGYENKPAVWGWMGPATRKLLNTYLSN